MTPIGCYRHAKIISWGEAGDQCNESNFQRQRHMPASLLHDRASGAGTNAHPACRRCKKSHL
jgi:hypothetical protein